MFNTGKEKNRQKDMGRCASLVRWRQWPKEEMIRISTFGRCWHSFSFNSLWLVVYFLVLYSVLAESRHVHTEVPLEGRAHKQK